MGNVETPSQRKGYLFLKDKVRTRSFATCCPNLTIIMSLTLHNSYSLVLSHFDNKIFSSYSNRSTKRHLSVSSDELPPPKVPKKSEKRESEPKKSEHITSHTTIAEVENLQELDGEE